MHLRNIFKNIFMIKKFVKNFLFSTPKEWKSTESSGRKTDRRWSHCGFTQTWQRQRWELISLTGTRGENVGIEESMKVWLADMGREGGSRGEQLGCRASALDLWGWDRWSRMKKLVMEKETEEAVIDQIWGICRYRKKEVSLICR